MENLEIFKKQEDMPIVLQRATMDDVQELLEIEKSTIDQKTYSGYYTAEEIKEYINKEVVYFIKYSDKIAGSISYEIKDNGHAHIGGLVVKPDYRQQGLGREAMEKILEELKNYKTVDLVVHPDNSAAVNLYKSVGFVEKERWENHFGDGEPRLLMVFKK